MQAFYVIFCIIFHLFLQALLIKLFRFARVFAIYAENINPITKIAARTSSFFTIVKDSIKIIIGRINVIKDSNTVFQDSRYISTVSPTIAEHSLYTLAFLTLLISHIPQEAQFSEQALSFLISTSARHPSTAITSPIFSIVSSFQKTAVRTCTAVLL